MTEQYYAGKWWVRQEGSRVILGLTEEAADDFGMILHVELPEPGDWIKVGQPLLLVETAVYEQELASPVTGVVAEVNRRVETQTELIHRSPEGLGWLIAVECREEKDGPHGT